MNLQSTWPRIFPGKANLSFTKPTWNTHVGERGGYLSASTDGRFEAIAEPIPKGWRFWLVPVDDPSNALCMEDTCAF